MRGSGGIGRGRCRRALDVRRPRPPNAGRHRARRLCIWPRALAGQRCRHRSGRARRSPPFVPARRVLESLRAAVLARAEGAGRADRSPRRSFRSSVASSGCRARWTNDAAHRFAARLTGNDAQQLIVEMAHDMRSPLGSILILAERLRSGAGGELAPMQERQLGLIYSAAFGLSALAAT